ncbi:DUF4349 domain-containing protein [Cytophagaceae bacterium DM2B3-1]|uniref:DUF4349 domain-containing protein n=1 Tax=Xanthocytophaga flava TaxID=3048013 RepID=A0ABT7CHN5_9BACT|nr:DUF4349 domain-containing protein [Xanthocytophaga flavus]MDJ1493245.1 DUF4349 domain-containing protein [Xanthocytophaga flavus]
MKQSLYFAYLTIFLSVGFTACSSKKERDDSYVSESAAMTDTVAVAANASPQPEGNANFTLDSKNNLETTGRKFIRTADVKCKVKNVRSATNQIEDLTAKFDGFITNSNLQSSVDRTESVPVSSDSTLEVKTYTVTNNITLRIPNAKLDSLMRSLNSLVDFLDYRVVKAEDAGFDLLSNQLQQKRLESYENRMTQNIDKRGKKLGESTTAEENLLDRQNRLDQSRVHTLGLEDQIAYSTVHLQIYQRETVFREIIVNPNNIESYKPGLFVRLKESLVDGWYIFEEIVIFFSRLWFLFVIGSIAWILYRRYGKKSRVTVAPLEKS